MKLKDLKGIIRSSRDGVEMVTIYSEKTFDDINSSCSIEYAIEEYGNYEVKRVTHESNALAIGIDYTSDWN